MTQKLSRQQRRKLERTAKKKQDQTVNVVATDHLVNTQLESNEQLLDPINNNKGYRPNSVSPCYLLGPNDSKTVWKGGWVPPGSTVTVAGRKINGMVYIGKPPKREETLGLKRYPYHVYIDPDLEIVDAPYEFELNIISKARTYDKILPSDRGNYLDWLATDKADERYDPAYMQMYYMGLEYRYFVDHGNQLNQNEVMAIIDEIDHLWSVYTPNPIKEKLMQFRQFIFYDEVQKQTNKTELNLEFGDIDSVIALTSGTNLLNGIPLESSTVLHILRKHLTEEIKEVYDTCLYVFENQFTTKFNQMYPNGLQIPKPDLNLAKSYHALFGDFSILEPLVINDHQIPDIACSNQLKSVAISIGTVVADELKPYCNELKQNLLNFKEKREIEFLPDMGANSVKSIADKLIKDWADEKYNQNERVSYRDVLSLFKEATAEEMNIAQWYQTLVALNRVGYGVAPDLHTLYLGEDADVGVILVKYESDFDDRTKSSGYYHSELLSLIIGIEFFRSAMTLTKNQISIINHRLNSIKSLTQSEHERLVANFERMQEFPILLPLSKIIRDTPSNIEKEVVRESIKFYVDQDPSIISRNLIDIMNCYDALELDVSLVESDFELTGETKSKYFQLIAEANERDQD